MAYYSEPVTGDCRIQLGAEDYSRTWGFGTNWTKIRFSFTAQWSRHVVAFYSNGPVFGICAGTQKTYQAGINCTEFLGCAPHNTTYPEKGAFLFQNATSYLRLGGSTVAVATYRIAGRRDTYANMTNAQSGVCQAFTVPYHQYFMFDVQKVSPTSMIVSCNTYQNTGQLNQDATFNKAFLVNENEALSSPALTLPTASTYTFTNYPGPMLWDSVNISWDVWNPVMEICDVLVTRYW